MTNTDGQPEITISYAPNHGPISWAPSHPTETHEHNFSPELAYWLDGLTRLGFKTKSRHASGLDIDRDRIHRRLGQLTPPPVMPKVRYGRYRGAPDLTATRVEPIPAQSLADLLLAAMQPTQPRMAKPGEFSRELAPASSFPAEYEPSKAGGRRPLSDKTLARLKSSLRCWDLLLDLEKVEQEN